MDGNNIDPLYYEIPHVEPKKLNFFDHGAPAQDRRHRFKELPPSPEGADPGGAEHLMRAHHREVDAEGSKLVFVIFVWGG